MCQCNRLCGEGAQKRRVRCFRRVEGKIEVLGDSACREEKPEEEKPCELRPCEGVDWIVSDWSGVSEIHYHHYRTVILASLNKKLDIYV